MDERFKFLKSENNNTNGKFSKKNFYPNGKPEEKGGNNYKPDSSNNNPNNIINIIKEMDKHLQNLLKETDGIEKLYRTLKNLINGSGSGTEELNNDKKETPKGKIYKNYYNPYNSDSTNNSNPTNKPTNYFFTKRGSEK